jgi:hypothetical protein
MALVALALSSHEAAVHASLLGSRLPPAWHRRRWALMAGLGLDTGAHVLAAVVLLDLGLAVGWVSAAVAALHFGYWAFRLAARDRFFHAADLRNEPAWLKRALVSVDALAHAVAVVSIGPTVGALAAPVALAGSVGALSLFASADA